MSYQEWITNWLKDNRAYANCLVAVEAMAEAFPELTKVPGHVETVWGRRAHWWLKTPDGEVIDPTVSQFPGSAVEYDPWEPGSECLVGKCFNCGEEIWEPVQDITKPPPHKSICSPECNRAAMADLNGML